jgi:hypothetical protein
VKSVDLHLFWCYMSLTSYRSNDGAHKSTGGTFQVAGSASTRGGNLFQERTWAQILSSSDHETLSSRWGKFRVLGESEIVRSDWEKQYVSADWVQDSSFIRVHQVSNEIPLTTEAKLRWNFLSTGTRTTSIINR